VELPILHVDMDAFYVAVEVQRDPGLAGRPVIVGGAGDRGVVASASYEARAFGVRSAMPSAVARRLCPDAVFVHGDHARYHEVSARLHELMERFTPLIEPIALDEAFLDVSAGARLFGDGPDVARSLRTLIAEDTGLSCSVGVARSKLLAKLGSEAAKPSADHRGVRPGAGIHVVRPDEELPFLHAHPVRALWGVGPATLRRLEGLGVATVGDLAAVPLDVLIARLGQAQGRHLAALAAGLDPRPVVADRPLKSVSHEETFDRDVDDAVALGDHVVRMADAVAARLRAGGVVGRTVTLKVRYGDFTTITRSVTGAPTDEGPALARAAKELLAGLDVTPGVRLLGVAVTALEPAEQRQLSLDELFEAGAEAGAVTATGTAARPWTSATSAVDRIRERFGAASIGFAAGGGDRVVPGRHRWGPEGPDRGS
jgi:DNA polymerase-4